LNSDLSKKRVLVIGLDGLSPILVDKWIDELPTIRRYREEGWMGLSIPPIPAQTPVAWTTFMTGKNPGKHGIYSFITRLPGTYERRIAKPQYIQSKTLDHLLSKNGKKVGVINVPMNAYNNVRGFVIPGFLSRKEGIPQPSSVQRIIKDKYGIEKISGDVDVSFLQKVHTEPEAFIKRINQLTNEQTEVGIHLMKNQEWDFFMMVYLGADRLQHFFWKYVDERHPEYQENILTEKIKNYYIKLDQIIGKFIEGVPSNTLKILLSDHGFCPVWREVIINNYLEELGFLTVKNERIDSEDSKAIAYGYGDIWLNVKGREPNGIVNLGSEYATVMDEIKNGLMQLNINGERPIKAIKEKEKIYWGDNISKAPDLTVIFNTGWQAARRPEIMKKNDRGYYVNESPLWSGGHDGTHDPLDVPGIAGFLGSELSDLDTKKVFLRDFSPTILDFFEIEKNDDIDGESLQLFV
jgi:predicted AlkP superfamily phosphohydrolase/phosphomutase